jgi:hypothetical protein
MTAAKQLSLVRDVLDKQLLDRQRNPMGRVDGIILALGSSTTPPRVTQIEVGITTLARRVHPRLAEWCRAIGKKSGLRRGRPVRIAWAKVESIEKELKLDLTAEHSELLVRERWLRDHVIRHIPGGARKPSLVRQ